MDHLNLNIKDSVQIRNKKKIPAQTKQMPIRKSNSGKKKPLPFKLIFNFVFLLAALSAYYHFEEEVMGFVSRIEVGFLSKSQAQQSPGEKSTASQAQTAQTGARSAKSEATQKTSWTQEEINIFKGLEERKMQLDEREKALNALAEELQKQEMELDKKIVELKQTREDISKRLSEQVEKDEEKLNKLVEVYSNMKPQSAAEVIGSIDEGLAVDILVRMKKANAANILNLIEPQKAKRLSEKFAGYVRK